MTRFTRFAAIALLAVFAGIGAASAADYPSKPLRMIVPFAAGASTDMLGRTLALSMAKRLGQSVVVENRTGAGGVIAAQVTATAAPDGYTILLSSAAIQSMNPLIYKKLPYDPVKDFAPITIAVGVPLVIVVNPALPIHTIKDLLDAARAQPGSLTFGSSGTGTSQHLAGELLKYMAKVDLVHVPYRGGAPAITDLLGGQISMMFGQVPSALPHIKTGRMRAIAVGSPQRLALLPNVPTVSESGLPGYDGDTWYGFLAPAGTPPAIVAKLRETIVFALAENSEKLVSDGFVVVGSTSEEMSERVRTDTARLAKVVRAARIEAD